MKSDGDCVSLAQPEQVLPYLTSSFRGSCGLDSLTDTMVPCKTASDTNGNDIRGAGNNIGCGGEEDKEVSQLTSQVTELQKSLSSLQSETDTTITKLRQELADKANIVETLQQQIRMKMFLNLTKQSSHNPVMTGLADMHGPPEDLLSSWRKSLEASLLGQGGPGLPFPPNFSPMGRDSPCVQGVRADTPERRGTPLEEGSKTPGSEDGRIGSPGSEESRSPRKMDEGVSPTPSPVPPHFKSFPPNSSPLSVPSIFTSRISKGDDSLIWGSRIPKGDPLEERLHDMLRYNMEKFAGQPIDTLADSRRVRELLSVHNIGQRLFAKYVLGLSQGTVSELLSKPKSWDKLTEKGRDSYRKMHAWVWDDQAILLLKTLIPRKGELLRSSSSVKTGTWHLTQPLSGLAQQTPKDENERLERSEREDRSHSEHRINKILSEVNKSHENLLPKFPHIDVPVPPGLQPGHGLLLPSLPPSSHSEELKMALSFYQDQLAKSQGRAGVEEEERSREEEEKEDREEKENQESKEEAKSPFSLLQAKLDHFPRGPPLFPPPGFIPHSMENPLQMMASITNNLISQPLPCPSMAGNLKMKAILPPITQQQFDHFSHLNTDEVVRGIKEILSQYSISQRLFGEAVLGLSQGSVSDLLARPKPWHMLTQKGREPFIRMKLFLEDGECIHKLVASQYKIVPDQLLRKGVYSGNVIDQSKLGVVGNQRFGEQFRRMAESPLPALIPNRGGTLGPLASLGPRPPCLPGPMAGLPHLTPNLYEMAALTQELDTNNVTNKVKELLLSHNTGQKLFGEAVLGLSQGSVSELLAKPKPWHMLSIKGREPFIRMQLWLNDPHNMDKLLAIKKLQEETRRRKRTFEESFSGKSSPTSDLYSNPGEEEGKRPREGGLDLSFNRREEEEGSDGERMEEEGGRESPREQEEEEGGVRKNRRKPAAPQWLNTNDWTEEQGEEGQGNKTINGVCVMNTTAVFPSEEQEN